MLSILFHRHFSSEKSRGNDEDFYFLRKRWNMDFYTLFSHEKIALEMLVYLIFRFAEIFQFLGKAILELVKSPKADSRAILSYQRILCILSRSRTSFETL